MTGFEQLSYERRSIRLALGIEPVDAGRSDRAGRLSAGHELTHGVRSITRHASGVFSVLQSENPGASATIRFVESSRRYVPRRLNISLQPGTPRFVTPRFFPGAAYDCSSRTTAIRGRVVRGNPAVPMRWARLEARIAGAVPRAGRVVGTAHGDDRGEFLLLVEHQAETIGPLVDPLSIEITAFGPLPGAPIPANPDLPSLDPLWDLPSEPLPLAAPPSPERVAAGVELPPGYGATASSTVLVNLKLSEQNHVSDIVFQ